MATKKVQFKIYVSQGTMDDMDLLYDGLCGVAMEDPRGRIRVDVSRSIYWESVIREHLKSNEDMLRMFQMIKDGTFKQE